MKLFNVINQVVMPTTEILLIYPFKDIWERDYSEHKFYAIKEFTFIEFMCSPKKTNPFIGYSNVEERAKKIISNIYNKELVHETVTKWQPDDLVIEGMKLYREFLLDASPSLTFLESAENACEKLKQFFNTVNLNQTNVKGALLYKPRDVTSALKDTESVVKQIFALREKVEQELFETSKTLKNRTINPYEESPLESE